MHALALREHSRQVEPKHLTQEPADTPSPATQAVQLLTVLEQRVQLGAQGAQLLPMRRVPSVQLVQALALSEHWVQLGWQGAHCPESRPNPGEQDPQLLAREHERQLPLQAAHPAPDRK